MPCCHPDPNFPSDPHRDFTVTGTCTNERCSNRGTVVSKVVRHCADGPLRCPTCQTRLS